MMKKLKLNLENLNTENDSEKFIDYSMKIEGVVAVKASHETGKVVVVYNENKTSSKELTTVLENIKKNKKDDQNSEGVEKRYFNKDILFGFVTSICIFSVILNIVLVKIIY